MIRSRDFFLFLVAVAFLILGISLTIIFTWQGVSVSQYSDSLFNQSTATTTAEVVAVEDDRESRIDTLRKKIAAMPSIISAPVVEESLPSSTTPATTTASTTKTELQPVLQCSNYRKSYPAALNGLLTYSEEGGQRLFVSGVVTASTGTPDTVSDNVAFRLPIRKSSQGMTNCLVSDIVAITPFGLPIRNEEFVKYSGSGEATLIGYTLDGYELFGQNVSLKTDKCGGVEIEGKYRYYLSPERKAAINCFVGIPVAI